jgi:type IV secretion system protein VirB8
MKWIPRKSAGVQAEPAAIATDGNYAAALQHLAAKLADADPREMARLYFREALSFEKSRQQLQEAMTKVAWRVAGGAMFVALASILGSAALVELKRPEPPVIIRDNTASGDVQVIDVARRAAQVRRAAREL